MYNLKKYLLMFFTAIIFLSILFFLLYHFKGKSGENILRTIYDTTLLIRYEKEICRDTVIKWRERINTKKSEPEIIYYSKTDTVFTERVAEYDLMLQIKKNNDNLIIKAINTEGRTLKEYIYKNVYDNFSVVSQKNNIFVKTSRLKWNGISATLNIKYPLGKSDKPDYQTGIETGIKFINRLDLSASINYTVTKKQLFLKSGIKIKF